MEFEWVVSQKTPQLLRTFLRERGISRGLLAKIKFAGGHIAVNGCEQTVRHMLHAGDCVRVRIPNEAPQNNVLAVDVAIDVLYEDAHFLAVNKPAGVASIPSYLHPRYSMANRVKGYLVRQQEPNQVIHVVTRLDRDTTGVMLFAKHQFAHALLDSALRTKQVDKRYVALLPHGTLTTTGMIDLPIGRSPESIMTRQICAQGKPALTEYEVVARYPLGQCVAIRLHTGRTHQIRVHFSHIGLPLLGDALYGGLCGNGLERQALHCRSIRFFHPFRQEWLTITAPLAEDMAQWCQQTNEVVAEWSN